MKKFTLVLFILACASLAIVSQQIKGLTGIDLAAPTAEVPGCADDIVINSIITGHTLGKTLGLPGLVTDDLQISEIRSLNSNEFKTLNLTEQS
jgi:hypothetical protein